MSPHPVFLSRCMAVFAIAAVAMAQVPTIPVASGATVRRLAHAAVAEGRDYRATIDGTAMTFLPVRGERAPVTAALALHWLEHGRDARRVAGAEVVPGGDGLRVLRTRAGIVERYDAHADGVELSVVFAERPTGVGDLVVRYRVDTGLPVRGADARGVTWADDHGGVHLGAVTGIDADGVRADGTIDLEGDVLSLSLPAAFVDRARFPLVLDPLLSTVTGVASGYTDTQPAIAWDATSQRHLLVWRLAFSAVQSIVRAQLLNANGVPTGAAFTVNPSIPATFVSLRPSVAARSGEFYVGWSGALNSFLVPNCYAARVTSTGVVTGETLLLAQGGFLDLCGTTATNLVSYATYSGLDSFLGQGQAGLLLWNGTSLVPTGATSNGAELATFARGAVPAAPFVVRVNGPYLQVASMANLASQLTIQVGTVGDVRAIAAAMRDHDHGVVVWAQYSWFGPRCDVYACAFRTDPVSGLAYDSGVTLLAGDQNVDEHAPTVAWLGTKYAVAWQAADGNGHLDVVYREFSPTCGACGTTTPVAVANTLTSQPVLVARTGTTGAATGNGTLVAVRTPGPLPIGGALVLQQVVDAIGGPVVEAGPGCGFAGTADTTGGPCAVGNADFTWRLTNWPAAGLTFLDLGFPGGEITCGLCTFTNPVVLEYVVPQSATEVRRTMPIPCDANLIGATIAGQWLLLGAAATPCALVPNLTASRRLHATIAP